MNRKYRTSAAIAKPHVNCALAPLALGLALAYPIAYGAPAGKTLLSVGKVAVIRDGKAMRLGERQNIEPGDRIITGAMSAVHLRLTDGSQLALDSNTDLRVQAYAYDRSDADIAHLHLAQGHMRVVTGDMRKDRIRYETPTADVRVQGTVIDFLVQVAGLTVTTVQNGLATVNGKQSRTAVPQITTAQGAQPAVATEGNAPIPNAQTRNAGPDVNARLKPGDVIVDTLGDQWDVFADSFGKGLHARRRGDDDKRNNRGIVGEPGSYRIVLPASEKPTQTDTAFARAFYFANYSESEIPIMRIIPAANHSEVGTSKQSATNVGQGQGGLNDLFDKIPDLGVDVGGIKPSGDQPKPKPSNNTNIGESVVGTGWDKSIEPSQEDGYQKIEWIEELISA